MYAIIRAGTHQYRVSENDVVRMQLIDGEVGASVSPGEVLSVHDGEKVQIGRPVLEGASVEATILRHGRDKKILIHKFKRRKGYAKTQGHRQGFTELKIGKINVG